MGHADLQTTDLYVKLLPQPRERNRADRLNHWLDEATRQDEDDAEVDGAKTEAGEV